jgi:hypothetical protein
MCAEVARPGAVMRYWWRSLQDWCHQARTDLGRRWRELRGIEPSEFERMCQSIENRIFDQENW